MDDSRICLLLHYFLPILRKLGTWGERHFTHYLSFDQTLSITIPKQAPPSGMAIIVIIVIIPFAIIQISNIAHPYSSEPLQDYCDKRRGSKQFNHFMTIKEGIGCIGWVTVVSVLFCVAIPTCLYVSSMLNV